ncbi:MAG: diacylglycerol kinase [Oscillospiraceae bacterium]|nr:diacylglycerol kinase [Oscillospiraceae bacterium]
MILSLRRALAGVGYAVKHERNMRIHLCVAAYVVLFGALAALEAWAWAACLVCVGMVLCAELHNTSIERLCDIKCPEPSEVVRVVKDTAAGGVLMAAAAAAVVGIVVFFRVETLTRLWERWLALPWLAAFPALLLAPCVLFVRGAKKKDGGHES